MEQLRLEPIARMAGEVHLPGSKSLSNRVLLLAALADGTTEIDNLLVSDDVRHMLDALERLGVQVALANDGRRARVDGLGGPFPPVGDPPVELFLGNSGTTMRPLAAALTLGHGSYVLRGEARMHERPIGPLVHALQALGADIRYLGTPGYPPLAIRAAGLGGGEVEMDATLSSQFATALLMAAPLARAPVTLDLLGQLVSAPYLDITTGTMAHFGVEVTRPTRKRFEIPRRDYRSPGRVMIEGDASAASYFLAAGAIAGGPVRVHGIGRDSVQGDAAFADVLAEMGANVCHGRDWIEVAGGTLRGVDLDLNHIPDAAMTAVTTALFADGPSRIRNVANWRVKETDRLHAMATEARKLGAVIEEHPDGLTVAPPERLQQATIDTYDDHRIAMCFALAALGDAAVIINEPGCVAKTFPEFFDVFRSLATLR